MALSVSAAEGRQQSLYVSPSGNDTTGDGTINKPYASLERARQRVRTMNAGMTEDLTVLLRGGTYNLSSPVIFTEADSGSCGHKVCYKNVEGETPILTGGSPITGWTPESNGVYKAFVGQGRRFNVMSENGVPAIKARHPDVGHTLYTRMGEGWGSLSFQFYKGDVPTFDYANTQVHIWPGISDVWAWDWDSDVIPVTRIDWPNRRIFLEFEAGFGSSSAIEYLNRYYLQGARVFLTQPGEFYLDEASGIVYYWPRNAEIHAQQIVAPRTKELLRIAGSSASAPVRDLSFEGLVFTTTDFTTKFDYRKGDMENEAGKGMVSLSQADGMTFRFNKFTEAGLDAFHAHDVNNLTLYGNWIENIGASGIHLQGDPEKATSLKVLIANNTIYNVGLLACVSCLKTDGVGDMEISNNLISKGPRNGIVPGKSPDGHPVIVKNNDVSDFMRDSQDGGLIYTVNTSGFTFENNRLHHVHQNPWVTGNTAGIYLDNTSKNHLVKDNIIDHINGTGPCLFLKNSGHTVVNNILYDTQGSHGVITANDYPLKSLVLSNTIFGLSAQARVATFQTLEAKTPTLSVWDNNLYASAASACTFKTPKGNLDFSAWKAVYSNTFDHASVCADPLFVNAEQGDFRLQKDSPALALGFAPIDQTRIGLKPDFPWPRPVLAPQPWPDEPPAGALRVMAHRHAGSTGSEANVHLKKDQAYSFSGLDFGSAGLSTFSMKYGQGVNMRGGLLEIRLGSASGPVIGTVAAPPTCAAEWVNDLKMKASCELASRLTGRQTLTLIPRNQDLAALYWIELGNLKPVPDICFMPPYDQDYYSGTRVVDDLNDWSKSAAHSDNLVLNTKDASFHKNDASRAAVNNHGTGTLTYHYANIKSFHADVHFWCKGKPLVSGRLSLEASSDGVAFTKLVGSNQKYVKSTILSEKDGGHIYTYKMFPWAIPEGTHYVRLSVDGSGSTGLWGMEIAKCEIVYVP
jgi:hypothetical protein